MAVREVTAAQVKAELDAGQVALLLDVRENHEFVGELGHVAKAKLSPLGGLEAAIPTLLTFKDQNVVTVCKAGGRSSTAAALLSAAGFSNVRSMAGGMLAWNAAGLPVER